MTHPTPDPGSMAGGRTDVVLFMRHLGRVMAGGARAVLDRANLYARDGHRVAIVVVGPEGERGTAHLRRTGALDRRVRVLYLGKDAPDLEARIHATSLQPLSPPIPLSPGTAIAEEPGPRRGTVRRTYRRDGAVVARFDRKESGEPIAFALLDDASEVRELWRYSEEGELLVVDVLHGEPRIPVRRTFVVGGSLRWLEVDLTLSEGRGAAVRYDAGRDDAAPDPERPTLAQVVAAWLDEEFRDAEHLVVMADGENTAQHVLRAMRHPGVRGVSILHNAHTDAPHTSDAPVKQHWAAFLEDDTNVDLVVCLTGRQREHLERRYPAMPLRVVHHAVPERAVPTGVRRDPLRLVFVGRLAPQKRLDHLLDAFADVAARVPGASLDVYGSGAELGPLRDRVSAAGLTSRVTFKGFTDDAATAFASAAAAVMTSRYEGLPLTLTEAMSVGTPFVAYDIDYGPAEVIRDGVDGLLVPPGDVSALADALVRLLTEPGLAASLGERATEVRQRFSPQRYAQAWNAVLNDVAARTREAADA